MVQKVIQNQQQIPPWHQLQRAAFIKTSRPKCVAPETYHQNSNEKPTLLQRNSSSIPYSMLHLCLTSYVLGPQITTVWVYGVYLASCLRKKIPARSCSFY